MLFAVTPSLRQVLESQEFGRASRQILTALASRKGISLEGMCSQACPAFKQDVVPSLQSPRAHYSFIRRGAQNHRLPFRPFSGGLSAASLNIFYPPDRYVPKLSPLGYLRSQGIVGCAPETPPMSIKCTRAFI